MERAALTGALALAVVGLYLLMLRGWRSRQRRQGDLPAPPQPPLTPGPVLVDAVPGLFVGTTFAGDWLDRVAVHDLAHRAAGFLLVDVDGVHVEREGLPELFVPFGDLEDIGIGDAHAGKVVASGGLLLLDWRLGGRLLTSGFRATDPTAHARVVDAVRPQLNARPDVPAARPDSPAHPDLEAT